MNRFILARPLLAFVLCAVALATQGCNAAEQQSTTTSTNPTPGKVTIAQFDANGKRTGEITVDKIIKTDAEWLKELSYDQYRVARKQGTERAFTGKYYNNHDKGIYKCICCGTPLFDSETKYDSGSGWPSFYQPIAEENVETQQDTAHMMVRTEVHCKRCNAHLGHVFDDGPKPTGLRYCINSVSLDFDPADKPKSDKP